MILLEEDISPGKTADALAPALEGLLNLRWKNYCQALKRCRKKFSKKSVHALRVEIRRMLSLLALLDAVLPHELILPLECELRDRIKALSRLRDTHVQIDAMAEMLDDDPELEPFYDWLRRRERRLGKWLERKLANARTARASRRVQRLRHTLLDYGKNGDRQRSLEEALVAATERTFQNVARQHRRLTATNVAAIHRMRVAFKQFRYMAEALAAVVPGITDRQLRAMQVYQSRMGEIQDAEVLLNRAEKFARKGKWDKSSFRAFREKMLRCRTRVIKRFLASADRLLTFWPAPSCPTSSTRRSNGIVYSPARHRG